MKCHVVRNSSWISTWIGHVAIFAKTFPQPDTCKSTFPLEQAPTIEEARRMILLRVLKEGCGLVVCTSNLIHRDNGSKPYSTLHHRICEDSSVTKRTEEERLELPKASLAFARGNFSTMQLMFSNSVNSIASSESVAWPLGQDWTESP